MHKFFLATLPVALFALILIAFTSCGGGSVDLSGGDADNGSNLYANNCAACHGATGGGSGTGPDIVGASGNDVYEAVRNGPGTMPSYKDIFSFSDIKDIYAYMQTF